MVRLNFGLTLAITLQVFVTLSNELGAGEEFLAKVAAQAVAEATYLCSYRYQAFTSLIRGAARSKPWNGGLGSAEAV